VVAEKDETARRPRPRPVRRCFVFRDPPWLEKEGDLRAAYRDKDPERLSRLLMRQLDLPGADAPAEELPLRVTHRPLEEWGLALPEDREAAATLSRRGGSTRAAALAIRFASEEVARLFATRAERARSTFGTFDTPLGDLRLNAALHWCPGRGEGDAFGSQVNAHRLIRADSLAAAGLDGSGVKVVVVDQGVDAARLPPGSRFMGGWWKAGQPGAVPPGQAAKDNHHGTMVARNVLALAPKAMIFDCPLIPPRILGNMPAFLSDAFGALTRIADDIALLGQLRPKQFGGRWVIVNAWSVYDARGEAVPGEYIRNRYHWVACAVDHLATTADVVFAAGNCGAFGPDSRCAEALTGPGHSILGANSLDSVLTVGAARSDGIWAGYSSQGPGQFPGYGGRVQQKPDLAAPSHFREPGTAHRLSGGSSAACAVAAGAVAALRTRWPDSALPSAALYDRLRASAWQPDGSTGWNNRHGHGVLDCEAALQALAGVPVS
jgi:hypothetical protein